MKKSLFFFFFLIIGLFCISGCGAPRETDSATEPQAEPFPSIVHFSLGVDDQYTIGGGDTLYSYYEEPFEHFLGVCKFYEERGWTLYRYSNLNDNHFATYTSKSYLIHIYWIACERELNVVVSLTGADALPPSQPSVTEGDIPTSVTQLQSSKRNGMGYVIQLADGSFLIQDGGYPNHADELWSALVDLNGGEEGIVIRAWIITHAHHDHKGCFSAFAPKYGSQVTLETLMISPLSDEDAQAVPYLNSQVHQDLQFFDGASLLYVHTGMVFSFCNVTLEILYTPNELWISDPTRDGCLNEATDFNNSSIVSRIYTDNYKALFLADASEEAALRMALYYGDYLNSDMCQMAHHGVEDFPLIAYRFINASILWCPCTQELYDLPDRDAEVRMALSQSRYTQEIILHEAARVTRLFPTETASSQQAASEPAGS